MSSGPSSSKYMVLARLFEMVEQLSEDQKLALIKSMHNEVLTSHLTKMIIDLEEEQQQALLERLKEMTSVEIPERTVDLDEREATRPPGVRATAQGVATGYV